MDQAVDSGRGLRARYRDAAPAAAAGSDAIDLMLSHRSVRSYRADAVPAGTLEALVAAGQSAATSSNLQLWSVVAVEDQGRRDRLSVLAGNQAHIRQAPLFLCWIADLSRAARVGAAGGVEMAALPYTECLVVSVIDAALAAQNATVAAESLGLGTVYIGGMRNQPEAVAAELGLPPGCVCVFGLCVGFEEGSASVKPRLPQGAVLHRERYATEAEPALLAGYDTTLQAFQAEQAMTPQGWTAMIRTRLGRVAALSGRDRLLAALHGLGFGVR